MASSVFQPMCGIFSSGSAGVILSTSPAIQPRPLVTSYSSPRSAMSCMPTQMPRNGRPRLWTRSLSASIMPSMASRPRRQSAKAPTPGSTMRSARATASGLLVTTIGCVTPDSRAARSNALAAECRLPDP